MVNQQLIEYIKQQLGRGITEEEIKKILLNKGWPEEAIKEAFQFISGPNTQFFQPKQQPKQPLAPSQEPATTQVLPSAKNIFYQALSIYKQKAGLFLGIIIIPILFLKISLLLLKPISGNFKLLVSLLVPILLIVFIAQMWAQISLVYAVSTEQKISITEAYRKGWSKLLSFFWISILIGVIVGIGFLLLIVPGIIFSVWFSLAVFILVNENIKGMNALLKSKEYVKGKVGAVLWRLSFVGIVSFLLYLIPVILKTLKIPLGEEIGNFIVELFLIPFSVIYLFLIYNNLKDIKKN